MNINISIIIPHRNTPDLLLRCLQSIPKRDDIQILVIDDASDNFDKVHISAIRDQGIDFIQTNTLKGAGHARNIGLRNAKGKWIMFADADDFFLKGIFENIIDKYISSDSDIIYFGATSIYDDSMEEASRHMNIMNLLNDYNENNFKSIERLKYYFINPICKLFRRTFIQINGIKFDEVMYSNDVMFSTISSHYAKKIQVCKTQIYCITVNKGTLTKVKNLESVLCRYEVNLRRNQFLRLIGKSEFQYSIMNHLLFSLRNGNSSFISFIKLAIMYRANPFIGWSRWFNTFRNLNNLRE